MAITRSWTATGSAPTIARVDAAPAPRANTAWVAVASLFVAAGLALVYAAKTERMPQAPLIDLNSVQSAQELQPLVAALPDRAVRDAAAEAAYDFLERARPLRNVGALAAVRAPDASGRRHPVLPMATLKPLASVRTPAEFRAAFFAAAALYFGGFWLVALVWRWRRFRGDHGILPALEMLTGAGLIVMAAMRDPLRDTLEFHKFAVGVFLGCLLLTLPAFRFFDYRRLSDWCYTPLFGALTLFGALMAFGRGPAGNDAKVNLGPFQPVEAIKILLVLYLAGYFTRNWERLRDLRERRLLPAWLRRAGLPRAENALPVLIAVGGALVLFFTLKDLGPALVTFFVFLSMFAVARGRPGLAIAGLVLMVGSVAAGYRLDQPRTVVERIDMWLAPWDNNVRGGDQLAHAIWAFSTGGPTGSGPGWGDPQTIPAGNTDLVLPALGEEWGFAGVASVFLLSGFLVWRGYRAGARASTHFGFFLGVGLASLIAFEMALISAGVLGVLPLSGVVSPFLSSGNTAMLANFAIFALVASISADPRAVSADDAGPDVLRRSLRPLLAFLACAAIVLVAFAAHYQVLHDRDYLARDSHAIEADGVKRPQHNPRLNSMAREIPRGNIYDRNGIPVATGDWDLLQRHRAEYEALGVSLDSAVSRYEQRHYPFGGAAAHITGDLRTGESFHATNASLVEHDSDLKLRGYRYEELAELMRYRHQPANPGVARVLARDRDVHLTLDIRLQLRAREILERRLAHSAVSNGAVVVLDAATGDVLAMVSAPAPAPPAARSAAPTPDELLDRARYGLYPPGSTFKLVTAIAALRLNPELTHRTFLCRNLGDGRAGNVIPGWNRAIKDDIGDHAHGSPDMSRAIAVSCNAYFAQLGVHDVGSKALAETAAQLGISTGDLAELRRYLPFAAYGQGPVLVSPFKMARVSAAIAAGGQMPSGRWQQDQAATGIDVIPPAQAAFLAAAMRRVVTEGTGRAAMAGTPVSMAGKTGTAQLDQGMPHSWFTGFAPYDGPPGRRLAFAVLVEHGGYGARAAAPIAREVMEAAASLGLLGKVR